MPWRGYKGIGYITKLHHFFFDKPTGAQYSWPKYYSLCKKVHRIDTEEWIDTPMPRCIHCERIINNNPELIVSRILKQRG